MWDVTIEKQVACKDAVLIEGLPGIGNVGKIAVDYLVEQLEATKIADFFSSTLPNSVFVTENNLIQLPTIELYHVSVQGKDFLLLTGDTQPSDERASYALTRKILEVAKQHKVKHIITTGGIGLEEVPQEPKLYTTGNNKKFVKSFAADNAIHGVVGPIVGVSGLLLGLADVPAATLLVETYAHPMYVGLIEAKTILQELTRKYELKISYEDLDAEIHEETEDEPKKKFGKPAAFQKDMHYIG